MNVTGRRWLKQLFLGFLGLSIGMGVMMLWPKASPPPASKSDKAITLEFWTLQMLDFAPFMEAMIADYERTHPGVTIHWVDIPFSEGEKKAISSMLAQVSPDVINLNPNFSSLLAQRGALVDYNDWLTPEQRASYLPVTLQAATYDGHTFGLPWYITSAVTMVNEPLLTKAGLKAPPKDYAELAQAAQAFKDHKAGYVAMPALANGGQFFKVMVQQGIRVFDPEARRFVFADAGTSGVSPAAEQLSFWVSLFKSGLIPREVITEGPQASVDRYQSGSLGLLLTGPNFLKIVQENAPTVYEQTVVAHQFPQASPAVDFSAMILVVPKRSAHPKAAVDFALFVTNPRYTQQLSTLAPVLSPHRSALSAMVEAKPKDVLERARQISAQQLLDAQQAMPLFPKQSQLNQIMDYYVQQALLEKRSPQAALFQAQTQMNAQLAE